MTTPSVVYLDLDGVIVNFADAVCRIFDKPTPYAGPWCMATEWGITPAAMWDRIDSHGVNFWQLLDWTAEGREILALLEGRFAPERICLLSSPSLSPASSVGKLAWIRTHMPAYARRFALSPCKHLFAHAGALLVDDCDDNVLKFAQAGGQAVLVPRPWNWRGTGGGGVVESVKEQLGRCF